MKLIKMLIVDDDKIILAMVRDFFTATGGSYDFITAEDGEEALKMCLEKRPNIIITDIMIPKMNGIAFISALKGMTEFSAVPIIAMTAGNEDMKASALRAGADSVLEKPLRRIDLIQKVDELLDVTPTD